MGLETFDASTFISTLNISWPLVNDPRSEGDDHIRGIKRAIKQSFPNVNAAVTPTAAQLNLLTAVGATETLMRRDSNNVLVLPFGYRTNDLGLNPGSITLDLSTHNLFHARVTTAGPFTVTVSNTVASSVSCRFAFFVLQNQYLPGGMPDVVPLTWAGTTVLWTPLGGETPAQPGVNVYLIQRVTNATGPIGIVWNESTLTV